MLFLLLSINTFCYDPINIKNDIDNLFKIVPEKQVILMNGKEEVVNMRYLINMTAMMESCYGGDKYKGKVAKTYMQVEENTAKWYFNQVPELKIYIEEILGRKLIWYKDKDAIYTVYLIYISKFIVHNKAFDKKRNLKYFIDNDVYWYVYKIMYNGGDSGGSNKNTWDKRKIEFKVKEI